MRIKLSYEQLVPNGPDDFDRAESQDMIFDSIQEAIEFLEALKSKEE